MAKIKQERNPELAPVKLGDVPVDVLMNYYRHQYERMAKLEDQRTAITNITITLSVLAFTFGFDMGTRFGKIAGFGLLTLMVLANMAVVYANSRQTSLIMVSNCSSMVTRPCVISMMAWRSLRVPASPLRPIKTTLSGLCTSARG